MLKPVIMQLCKTDGTVVTEKKEPLHNCDRSLQHLFVNNPYVTMVTVHIEDEVGERDVVWTPLRDRLGRADTGPHSALSQLSRSALSQLSRVDSAGCQR